MPGLGENKIAELGPKDIFNFQFFLYSITLSLYSTVKVS